MSTPSTRRPTEDRQREIADAALRLIAEQGLRRFTTAAVAERVGLSEGAIFRHFPSKQAIVAGAIDRVEELLFAAAPEQSDDPLERLGEFVRFRIETIHANPGIPRIVFSEELAHAAGPEGAERIGELKRRSFAFVRGCLEEAAQRGLVVTDVPLDHLVLLVQGLLLALVFRSSESRARSPRAAAEQAWTSVERLIRSKAS